MSPRVALRLLATLCVLLALACAVLAWRYGQARDAALCWRAAAEEGVAAEGDCSRIR
jgi:uncharacterized membrane protein YqjE